MRHVLAAALLLSAAPLAAQPADRMPIVKVAEGTPTTINDGALVRRLESVMVRTPPRRSR